MNNSSQKPQATGVYTVADAPLSWRHIGIVASASLGQLIGTGLATLVSVIIPLIQILGHPHLSSVMQGLIGAADLIGIAIGSAIFGKLIDRNGYLFYFRLCPAIVLVASLVAFFVPDVTVLIICLFVMGLGIGGEYSLDSAYISELMPAKWKFIMVGSAKASSSLGNIGVAAVCFWIVSGWKDAAEWPNLLWVVAVIAGVMLLSRIGFHESPQWLLDQGKTAAAEKATHEFLGDNVYIEPVKPHDVVKSTAPEKRATAGGPSGNLSMWSFIKNNVRNVIFTGIPWACEGLGVYGIGVFLPILVMVLGLEPANHGEGIRHVASSVEITLWISCIILPGFVIGLLIIGKLKGFRQQALGFYMCAVSLLVLLLAYRYHWDKWIAIGAFMAFELFLNMGPHLMTYVLPSKIYPVKDRGAGTGIAASIGKIGAVLGVFFIPVLLKTGGADLVLIVSIAVMLIGGIVTDMFRPETN